MSTSSPSELTLVLTDVVDSTKLAARLGDAANADVWDRHDEVARALVAHWDGTEVERTDGILALFSTSVAALGFAREYQAALERLDPPLQARVGIHRGPIAVRRNPHEHVARGAKPLEADGLSLSVTARINSIARGRQILVSKSALPPEGSLVARGHWQLKGAPEPVEVYEAPRPQVPLEAPVENEKAFQVVRDGPHWLPVRHIPRALPAEFDRFVGRADDLAALHEHLGGAARLVTVTGPGGTGKTRLSVRYGWLHLGEYRGGVWFCDLSEARDAGGIVRAVAAALGVSIGGGDPVEQLGTALADRGRCLLVLDNFEQIVGHAPQTVRRWLEMAQHASVLVTSRERLGIPGEMLHELEPLHAPDSRALFEDRAAAVRARHSEQPEVAALDRLLELLDHLPLAIELAAARSHVLSPEAMLDRISERFRILRAAGARDERQATLRATLDWSWDLLTEGERRALAQLSVFEGGFDLAAAEAVLALGDEWPMDAVQSLVDKSLVRRSEGGRFDLLVTVQAYARDRLDEGSQRTETEARHGRHFAALSTSREVEADLDNVVVACRRAAARQDADVAVPTLKAAWSVLDRQGPPDLAAVLANEVGDLPGLTPGLTTRVLAEALLAQGEHAEGQQELRNCLVQLGRPEPASFPALVGRILYGVFTQVRRRWGSVPKPSGAPLDVVMTATRAYQRLVETYWFVNEPPRMLGAAITALNLCEPLGPTPELARAYATLALATSGLRFDETADQYAALALQTAQGTDGTLAEAYVRFLSCVYRIGHARWDEVDRDLEIARELFEEAGDHRLLGDTVTVQGMAALYRGWFDKALPHFDVVRRSGRAHGNAQHRVWGALGAAEAYVRQEQAEPAATMMAEAMEVLEGFASPTEAARAWGLQAVVELACERPDAARAAADEAVRRLTALGPPTAHYLLEGYAGAAEVLLSLDAPAGRALRLMRTYAGSFPIGQPRLAWLQAQLALRNGRERKAAQHAVAGLSAAERLQMPFEQARLAELWPHA